MSPLLIRVMILILAAVINIPMGVKAEQNNIQMDMLILRDLLREAEEPPPEPKAVEQIYMKGDVMFCTGKLKAALVNNEAAELIIDTQYPAAAEILENALTGSSLFFPFRYNLGLCYLHMNRLDRALLHLNKAALIVPEFSRTYLHIGYAHQLMHRDSEAILYYREAIRRNPKELDTYIHIGDVFFVRGQVEMAKKYYDASLDIDPVYPNGLLGRAKVYFHEGKYVHAINLMRTIDTSGDYDRSLHYYYAESAYLLQDYETAAAQFRKLLEFKNDRFFITHSTSLIEHKLQMSERLSGR